MVDEDLPALCRESPLRFRRMDRYGALGLTAARLALTGGGVTPGARGDPSWGVSCGSSLGCWSSNVSFHRDLIGKPVAQASPAVFSRTVSNAVNGEISIAQGIGGPTETYVSGWTAGTDAVIAGCHAIAHGRARWLLAGGIEAPDPTLKRMHAERRRERGWEWLPTSLAEAAGMCLLTATPGRSRRDAGRLLAFWRAFDPAGDLSLAPALDLPTAAAVRTVILANSVPSDLLETWRRECGDRRFVFLPDRVAEPGAAGAGIAIGIAETEAGVGSSVMIIARDPEGATAALLFGGRIVGARMRGDA